MGDDLDAALSTVLYLHTHPDARLVGLYRDYTTVHHAADLSWEEVLDAVWLDLDIYHPRCRSLGHHIVRLTSGDDLPGFATSCNLNELVGRCVERDFTQKYPLGTIHFLMWLYALDVPDTPLAEPLIWLADSAYINGQSESLRARRDPMTGKWYGKRCSGFRWNVGRWLYRQMPLPSLQDGFQRIDRRAFEERVAELQEVLKQAGFRRGGGQRASRHLGLFGYQCQPPRGVEVAGYVRRLLRFVAEQTGWTFAPRQISPLDELAAVSGRRGKASVDQIRPVSLESFLREHRVFSFVFQYRGEMNFTTGLGAGDV